jgi:hypothetical protein
MTDAAATNLLANITNSVTVVRPEPDTLFLFEMAG